MCDATRLFLYAEPLAPSYFLPPPACDACTHPVGAALVFSASTGCFVLCDVCAERMASATLLAFALAAVFRHSRTVKK